MKHTQGPFVIVNSGANCLHILAEGVDIDKSASKEMREYYQSIATITQRDKHPTLNGGISAKQCRINANLFAASPDMLAALENIVSQYKTVYGIGDIEMQSAIDFAYKAIAKATGETK